jgi:hypothetical protein
MLVAGDTLPLIIDLAPDKHAGNNCLPCQVSWIIGANLFSSWQHETEAQQRADCGRAGIPRMRRAS